MSEVKIINNRINLNVNKPKPKFNKFAQKPRSIKTLDELKKQVSDVKQIFSDYKKSKQKNKN